MKIQERSFLRRRLLQWYDTHRRNLPWRQTKNPYHIWLSEIMLQQTQVSTVIPYYKKFLKAFPTLQSLARSKVTQVLKLWEGLGYYSRGRNLHRSAQIIVDQFRGKFPEDREHLEKLPGVGRSTAGAILSLAFDHREAILDANVKRVICRLYAIEKNLKDTKVLKVLWEYSHQLLPRKRVSLFNQGLMDLGAMVCTPKSPRCHLCPVEKCCLAKAQEMENRIPVPLKKKPVPHRSFMVGIVHNKGKVLIRQRPAQGFLGGLWEFPTFEFKLTTRSNGYLSKEFKKKVGLEVEIKWGIKPVTHIYTHFKGTYHPFLCHVRDQKKKEGQWLWVPPTRIRRYPFSKVYQKIIQQIVSPASPSTEQLTIFEKFKPL